jgi:glutamine synthetase
MSASRNRYDANRTASNRKPQAFARPVDGHGRHLTGHEIFGSQVFTLAEMRRRLPPDVVSRYQTLIEHGGTLDRPMADAIASAALRWAIDRGVSHFTHWFQPMTGLTAEKHDSFLSFEGTRPISQFTGGQLIQSEPDASSFPSGGIRSTFEARGYTAWDPTSPMFIMERMNGSTLCVPSVFFSYTGEALDEKTPLLRSMEAINTAAVRLCRLLGLDTTRVVPTAGPEQEYFLIDREFSHLRPDLHLAGRSVLGARAPKGQTLEDHYFGSIPTRVLAFMHELETELYRVGVPAKTRHNEVAPSQFELAVIYGEANVAADHNQLVMEYIRKVASKHDFTALLHEKPFAGVNGSGKHLNWSLQDEKGDNLLEPSRTPRENVRFLAFLSGVVLGVHRHAGLLRAAIASHGNDFRLGANEAPPAIISVFLGEQLDQLVRDVVAGGEMSAERVVRVIELGVHRLPPVSKDTTDRNRTSPFAFTGNKFEFRALGANATVSFALTALNTAMADGITAMADLVEKHGGTAAGVAVAAKIALTEALPVCFEGNNYSEEWVVEAERRGLPHLRNTPDALACLGQESTIDLFTRHKVLQHDELHSRHHIKVERYLTTVDIEVDVILELVDQHVLPSALAERVAAASDLIASAQVAALGVEVDLGVGRSRIQKLSRTIDALMARREAVANALSRAASMSVDDRAQAYARQVQPAMADLRDVADQIEGLVADERWSLPRYREMLFPV